MGKTDIDTIQLATGPYNVTKESAPFLAEHIRYRHYKPDEIEIAREFIRKAALVGTYFFDYYLLTESAKKIVETQAPPMLKDIVPWMLRIDAVCFKGKDIFLIEFEERASSSGIGQQLAYKQLWIEQHGPHPVPQLIYVIRDDNVDLHSTMDSFNIKRHIVVPRKA